VIETVRRRITKKCLGAANGVLTFVLVFGLGVITTQAAEAQTFTVLYNFTGYPFGADPIAGLVRDMAGNLYGTTFYNGGGGYGVVFKLDTTGKETILYRFFRGHDGENPVAGLILDAKGNLYGDTTAGGYSRYGVVFKVAPSGKETVLHSFVGGTKDGCYPYGSLLMDKAGNLYGTTEECGASGYGVVFKLGKNGRKTLLHSFAGGATDGQNPDLASLLLDAHSNLYGVTYRGGVSGEGVVYRLSKTGTLTLLHSFSGGASDGCFPLGTPVMDTNGNLFGTTNSCGSSGHGIVWELSRTGQYIVLHNFAGGASDGCYPDSGVNLDAAGNLYGTTQYCGSSNDGVVFKVDTGGHETVLHNFVSGDGIDPYAGVILDAAGNLYGTASEGGSNGYGTVFEITP